jgi:hypothetical protein
MTAIIHALTIDKKRKKCGIAIEYIDVKRGKIISPDFHFIA